MTLKRLFVLVLVCSSVKYRVVLGDLYDPCQLFGPISKSVSVMLTENKSHNLKIENYVLFGGHSEDFKPGTAPKRSGRNQDT